jgi:hypothetical protein
VLDRNAIAEVLVDVVVVFVTFVTAVTVAGIIAAFLSNELSSERRLSLL